VGGAINGFSLDLGVVDDPIKGQAESKSKTIRDKTWDWFTNDFFLRFSDHAGFVMIQTRWHVDDPTGRWLERFPKTKVLKYQAIAEPDDWSVKQGLRREGVALFPEFKSLAFLEERRKVLLDSAWSALYQQHPVITGGGIFPVDKLVVANVWDRQKIRKSVRYWDKAGTEGGGKRTAGVLMHRMVDGNFIIENVVKGHWNALDRETRTKSCAQNDRAMIPSSAIYEVWWDRPGSGGEIARSTASAICRGSVIFLTLSNWRPKEILNGRTLAAPLQNNNVR
jgi:hypothetical protein